MADAIFPPVIKGIRCILLLTRSQKYFFTQLHISLLTHKTVTGICTCSLPTVLLLHRRVGQLLSVDDQVSVVSGFECKASVTDPAAVSFLLVLLHDVLQVLFSFCKGQLETRSRTCVICVGHRDTWCSMWLQSFSVTVRRLLTWHFLQLYLWCSGSSSSSSSSVSSLSSAEMPIFLMKTSLSCSSIKAMSWNKRMSFNLMNGRYLESTWAFLCLSFLIWVAVLRIFFKYVS